MGTLSGGEAKRVSIVVVLACNADFYVLDEPTNHLDLSAIEFLESYLTHARCTLLMVTHDRYFLDSVCNSVMEMDHGSVYIYKGNYQNFLKKKQERIDNYNAETDRIRNLYRRELEWMHASPCARTGKAKYRKNAFYDIRERAEQVYRTSQVSLDEMKGASYLGTKIINCKDLSFSYGDTCCLSHFTYNFQRYERVGIVGKNGVGKSTFIRLLIGDIHESEGGVMTGSLERGESLKVGYYSQSGMEFDESQTVLETVNDTHLLSQFLFPHDMLNNRISKLSGGEKRRLYLLTVLMQKPNLLVMDEPTNDLDIVTLNILEEYLKDFKGTLVIVSHDRHFLDRLVDHLFVFCGDGVVKDFIGNFSQYREYIKDYEAGQRSLAREAKKTEKASSESAQPAAKPSGPRKLTYKERKELEQLEADIESLTAEKSEIESRMNGGITDFAELQKMSQRFTEISSSLDEKELRWLELSE